MLGKNTILKAIHNYLCLFPLKLRVWMLGKNTILKAIHNMIKKIKKVLTGVNAG